jgi:ATP-dependent DNA helicase RecQ
MSPTFPFSRESLIEELKLRLPSVQLRPLQRQVLEFLAAGKSVFAGLPTGYGKSLCFWAPAAAWGWRVWVVSPLISLMEDQAMACGALGLRVLAWHGQAEGMRARMERGDWQLCFLSPERLWLWRLSGYGKRLMQLGLAPQLIALDEMHCLDQWSSFRKGYAELPETLRIMMPRSALVLGLSASMSRKKAEAWMQAICGEHESVFAGLGRENLSLHVQALEEEQQRWLLTVAALRDLRAPNSALVYCASRGETDELARWLHSLGMSATAYHAGLPASWRSARSKAFREGHLRVVCATSAFGMGIDYPHVEAVIHFSLPYDLESYWQEVGRAGRSGREAFALAFWRRSEIMRARQMEKVAREKYFLLWRAWAKGGCRKQVVASFFGLTEAKCGSCDECLRENAARGIFPHLTPPSAAWWIRPEARLEQWLEKKAKAFGEKS